MRKILIVSSLITVISLGLISLVYAYRGGAQLDQLHKEIDARAEMIRLAKAMNLDSTQVLGTVLLFEEANENQPKETTAFSFARLGDNIYSEFGPLRIFSEPGIQVQVDSIQKLILIAKGNAQRSDVNPLSMVNQVLDDTVFKTNMHAENDGSLRKMTIESERNPAIRKCVLCYDPTNYLVQSAVIEWNRQEVLGASSDAAKILISKLSYTYQKYTRSLPKFQLQSVLSRSGKDFIVNEAYQDYQISAY